MRRASLFAAIGVALCFAGGAGSASAPSLQLVPCPNSIESGGTIFPNLNVDCGTLAVPENRSNANSRMIRVGVAIVHAPSGHPRSDPIVWMNGGPSIGSIQDFAWYYFYGDLDGNFVPSPWVQDRDLIVIDQRGEGVSTPYLSDPRLGCPEFNKADYESFYANPYIGAGDEQRYTDAVRACRDRLVAAGVDLSAYNSAEIAADLEA